MQSRYAIIAAALAVFLTAQVFGFFRSKAGPGASPNGDSLNVRQMMIGPAMRELPLQIVENPT
jgi:hypothetical protein